MKYTIKLALLLVGLCAYAQKAYRGKIVDIYGCVLAQATVQSQNKLNNAVISDANGNFAITLESGNTVVVKYLGYITAEKCLTDGFNTIILNEDGQALEEVVISASRETQQRKEVPASISVISSNDIEDLKAIGIDQLINNVPGVYMSTSRAASNEQHMMAVRTPISTKSLFLYVEDGLPIRPTAVFNHNALLEMNDIAFSRIEVLKGPASSIYGSEAIGGSFNFITKNPTYDFSGSTSFQINDMGLTRYGLELSQYANENTGLYLGTQYIQRNNGPVEHSDYEKFVLTFKTINHLSETLRWINVFDVIDYRSDMTGALSEADFTGGNYESDQSFTERIAVVFRIKSTLDKQWNDHNKTAFHVVFRKNKMDQIPSYRISQHRNEGQLTGFGSGETNSNSFTSFVGLIQHKIDLNFANSSLVVGASTDYSPQRYRAETLNVEVDTQSGKNIDYTVNKGDYMLNYNANILNYAGYFQYEINPLKHLKLTAALRYDGFRYSYNNLVDGIAGPKDSKNRYNDLSPKLGWNYNLSNQLGIYANYANGFSPPETATLYRNSYVGAGDNIFDLKPSNYNNYEVGTYFNLSTTLKADVAVYMLEGKNTLITLRNENDRFYNANAGKTKSYGIEYGIKYMPFKGLVFSHNGSFSKHKYISFFDRGVDYSNTNRETAPALLGTSKLVFKPQVLNNLSLSVIHEMVGRYNTSYENQIDNGDGTFSTAKYKGNNIFNVLTSFKFKQAEVWFHVFNIFDELYASRVSYNVYRKENTFSIGNPRAFHLGVKYNF